jgi:NitT/TauT family transport system substrate-binding protein
MMATFRRMAVLLLAILTLAGCSALGSDDSSSSNNNQGSGAAAGAPEKAKVKVAVLPTMDTVPLYLAMDAGYFKEVGLEVTPVMAASGADCVAKMVSGEVDFAFSSWTPFFVAKSKGVADVKLVADATTSANGYSVVSTMPNSAIQGAKDLAGKRVAITAKLTMSHLLVLSALKDAGVDAGTVQFAEMAFPQMVPALQGGQVDAAFLVEPFIQGAVKAANVRQVFDTNSGSSTDMPLTGYAATGPFVSGNKKTVEAFQRALKKATDDIAKGDRTKVDPLLEKIAKVDSATAKKTTLANFVSSLDPTKIQRVVDLMVEFKALDKRIEVADMVVKPPTA